MNPMSDEESNELVKHEADELEQMQLALEGEQVFVDHSQPVCRYTGEKFKQYYPDRYAAAIKLIAANTFSDRGIARFVRADPRVIRELKLSQIKDIEEQRALLKQKFFVGTMVLQERVMELADGCNNLQQVSVAMGIHKDGYLAVSGMPTARIEIDHKIDCGAELAALLREAEEKVRTIEARVIDPELENGEAA
jgi:hypothetical protein